MILMLAEVTSTLTSELRQGVERRGEAVSPSLTGLQRAPRTVKDIRVTGRLTTMRIGDAVSHSPRFCGGGGDITIAIKLLGMLTLCPGLYDKLGSSYSFHFADKKIQVEKD